MSTFTAVKQLCQDARPNPIKIVCALDAATNNSWRDMDLSDLTTLVSEQKYKDLLCACQMAATNPDCFDDWHAFHHVATAFNHRQVSFEFLDAVTYIEAAWACVVLRALKPSHDFGLGVQRYLAAICLHDGVLYFPWVGNAGLDMLTFYPVKGMIDDKLKAVVDEVKEKWKSGQLSSLSHSEVTDTDVLHVQFAKIVNAEEYVRACEGVTN